MIKHMKFVMDTDNGKGPEFLHRDNGDGTWSIATLDDIAELESKLRLAEEALEVISKDLTITKECREICEEMIPNALKDIDGIRDYAKSVLLKLRGEVGK